MKVNWTEQQGPIEKGVPIVQGRPPKYPFRKMEVGDSFMVRCLWADRYHVRSSVNSCARSASKTMGATFLVKLMDDGVRVWRTA